LPSPEETYWITPKRIEYALIIEKLNRNDKYRLRGGVIGGDWDLKRARFTEVGVGVFDAAAGEIWAGLCRGKRQSSTRGLETDLGRQISLGAAGTKRNGMRGVDTGLSVSRHEDQMVTDLRHDIALKEGQPFQGEDEGHDSS